MEYIIIQGGDLADLSKQVTAHIEQGWRPQGGVCSFDIHERDGYGNTFINLWFCQALVK